MSENSLLPFICLKLTYFLLLFAIVPSFQAGCFSVRLLDLKNQKWRWIVVDDYVPVDQNMRPVFSRGRDMNEVWVLLLEKCFAKLHGSYQSVRCFLTIPFLYPLILYITYPVCIFS